MSAQYVTSFMIVPLPVHWPLQNVRTMCDILLFRKVLLCFDCWSSKLRQNIEEDFGWVNPSTHVPKMWKK